MIKKVLITGGAGFLGRGFIRRAHREDWDWEITVFSRDESKHVRVMNRWPEVRIIKGDVTDDVADLARTFSGYDYVIHAGANKLVDRGEFSAFEVMRNNIVGSEHVALAAMRAGVERVIGISSDKAVQPVNTYGASKFLMERLFQEADTKGDTDFVCARYGNVVGSTISIVLYFREQLAKEGKIKITVPEMTRFYMGVDEAIDAVLYSLDTALPGAVVIPAMMAMTVADVARLVLGLQPNDDMTDMKRVEITGPRPGEKMHESLCHQQESVRLDNGSGSTYWELRPSIEGGHHPTFEITSERPPLGWMPYARMEALIEDAATL
jgi:FlaA1/EpsC-like NDP-sugar epimerase